MKKRLQFLFLFALALPGLLTNVAGSAQSVSTNKDARERLDLFNQQFISACQNMDHSAAAALWAADGVDLLPSMAPMVGKDKIFEWLNSLSPQLAGAKMLDCSVEWRDIQIHGDLAYEWGINRQKIEFPPPKKTFQNEGKILLILKRQADGSWKIAMESWNSNPEM